MASKRRPTSDLNHDNWDEDEKTEEQGVFKTASEDELKNRVIKKARRKITETGKIDGEAKSAFSSFSGFGKPATNSPASNIATSSFSFLSKLSSETQTDNNLQEDKNQNNELSLKTNSTNYNFQNSNKYYANLKNLNQEVSNWIKTHVDENPICILTPIFKDYEKYLKEIQENGKFVKSNDTNKGQSNQIENVPIASTAALKTFRFSADPPKNDLSGTTNNLEEDKIGPSFVNKSKKDNLNFGQPSIFESGGKNIFASSSSGFTFGTQTTNNTTPITSSGFSFTSSKPFTFGNVTTVKPNNEENGNDEVVEPEDDEPPKVDVKLVVEEDSIYSKRCKVFLKSNSDYTDRGVGTLYLKPITDSEKYQLIVRADTNLGNILLNIILNDAIPVQRMGKNNVMIVCIPTPECDLKKPVPTLLRVKTPDEADELMETINKYKK